MSSLLTRTLKTPDYSLTPRSARLNIVFDKSLVTNLTALLIVLVGYFLHEPMRALVMSIGLFALSGAVTNWLAIHMLFEKVPGFYGSGVIPSRFQDFKKGIRHLIMNQFFTKENLTRFFTQTDHSSSNAQPSLNLAPLIDEIDLKPSFQALKDAVMASKFGATLNMFGGAAALDPMEQDFLHKMRASLKELAASADFQNKLQNLTTGSSDDGTLQDMLDRVNTIVEKRLDELTPQMVKEIIQQMICDHLGWLVVWGGICGGAIGLIAGLL